MRRILALLAMVTLASATPATAADTETGLVLVAGATGRTGQHVVEQLLEQGHAVRVLSRSADSARALFGDRVEVVQGDVREPATLAPAVTGVRYVVWAVGSNSRADPSNSPEAVDYRGVKNLVEAAVAAGGVEHFVLVSSRGVAEPTHPLNRFANNILLWKGLGENALRFSGLPYTIVRPGGLTDDPATGSVLGGQDASLPAGSIARADVARVCVEALGNPSAHRKTVSLVADPKRHTTNWTGFFSDVAEDNPVRIGR
jgi:uncharacterized protein YbjT (DUF2867 family)